MKRKSFVSSVAAVILAAGLASLATIAGCSCGRVNTDDVKKPVIARPVEDAESEDYRLDEVTEEDLQAAEKKGYAEGLRDGQDWLRNNPNPGLIVGLEYPKDHGGYRQYQEIIAYNEGYLAGYQTALEYEPEQR
jgi:hypothetical protein